MFSILLVTSLGEIFLLRSYKKDNRKFTVTFYKYFTLYTELLLNEYNVNFDCLDALQFFDYTS